MGLPSPSAVELEGGGSLDLWGLSSPWGRGEMCSDGLPVSLSRGTSPGPGSVGVDLRRGTPTSRVPVSTLSEPHPSRPRGLGLPLWTDRDLRNDTRCYLKE